MTKFLRSPFSVLRSPFSVLRSPFSVLRSPFSVLVVLFLSFMQLIAQNLIQNGNFANTTFESPTSCFTKLQAGGTTNPRVTGWYADPLGYCTFNITEPSVIRSIPSGSATCASGLIEPHDADGNFLILMRENTAPYRWDVVRQRFSSPLTGGRYRLSFFVRNSIAVAALVNPNHHNGEGTLDVTIINRIRCGLGISGQKVGTFNVGAGSTGSQWIKMTSCFELPSNPIESFDDIIFDLKTKSGETSLHVLIDDVSLEKFPEYSNTDFSTAFTKTGLGFTALSMRFTPVTNNSSSLLSYKWKQEVSSNYGDSWNLISTTSSQGVYDISPSEWAYYRVTRTATSNDCPNFDQYQCSMNSEFTIQYEADAYDTGNQDLPLQNFDIAYNRNGNLATFTTSCPFSPQGQEHQWRLGRMWTFSGPDLPFFDPEWTDGGSTYSQNNVSSNFFYTLAHRAVAFGDPISNGDKISFNESHYYSCPTNLTNPIEPVESIKSASTNMNPNVSKALISNLEIFPNPTNGEAKLTYQSSSPSRISLFDVNGQEIMQKQVDSKGKIEEMINCGELNNGIYILKISNQDKVLAKKLIVRR